MVGEQGRNKKTPGYEKSHLTIVVHTPPHHQLRPGHISLGKSAFRMRMKKGEAESSKVLVRE